MGDDTNAGPRRHVYTVPAPPRSYGERIREERRRLGLDQTQLAELVNSDQSRISKLERGLFKQPDPKLLRHLEIVLELPEKTLTDLMDGTNLQHLPQPGDVIIRQAKPGVEELASIAQDLPTDYRDNLLEDARLYDRRSKSAAAEGPDGV
jgi:transcriptional regulator with XRE-family HTH domain